MSDCTRYAKCDYYHFDDCVPTQFIAPHGAIVKDSKRSMYESTTLSATYEQAAGAAGADKNVMPNKFL